MYISVYVYVYTYLFCEHEFYISFINQISLKVIPISQYCHGKAATLFKKYKNEAKQKNSKAL